MRPRKKKNLEERLLKSASVLISNPEEMKGHWRNGNRQLHLEIGCGKGAFICGMAERHPDIDFIAIEMIPDVIVMAMEKAIAQNISNVRFISFNAKNLRDIFEPGEIDRLYLNFSDPWRKSKQKKRRLTHPNFLAIYKDVLTHPCEIHFKTDNVGLFDDSLDYFKEDGWELSNVTHDLHNETAPENFPDTVTTEYESRFIALGQPINRLEAKYNK